jgi:hypothetical protein
MVKRALSQAGVPPAVLYTVMPVWEYRGPPKHLQPRYGRVTYIKGWSNVPSRKVYVTNFLEDPDTDVAMDLGWRRNVAWQRQVATARRVMTQAAVQEENMAEGQFMPTAFFCPFLPRVGEDRDIDSAPFWSDPAFMGYGPPLTAVTPDQATGTGNHP